MKNIGMFILFTIGLIYALYIAYIPWFNPEKWKELTKKGRQKVKTHAPYLPQNLTARFHEGHPRLDLWTSRIIMLIAIIIAILGIIVAIRGPF